MLVLSFGARFCIGINYVKFNTDSYLYNNLFHLVSTQCILTSIFFIILGLLFCECEKGQILLITRAYPNLGNYLLDLSLRKIKVTPRVASVTLSLYIFSVSVTPATCIITSPYYIKRYSLESWTSLSLRLFQLHVMEPFPTCSAH